MDSWMYYAIVIGWTHCKLYSLFVVAMDAETTTNIHSPSNQGNYSSNVSMQAVGAQTTQVSFINTVMPPCPPPGNLHLLCDVTIAGDALTCKERAEILIHCYNKYSGIYSGSDWSVCSTQSDLCLDIISFLRTKQLVTTKHHTPSLPSTSSTFITPTGDTTHFKTSNENTIGINTTHIYTTDKDTSSDTYQANADITTDKNTTDGLHVDLVTLEPKHNTVLPVTIIGGSTMTSLEDMSTAATNERISTVSSTAAMPGELTYSYIYPLVGVLAILVEVAILIYFFCCRKKRTSPSRKYKSDSMGSMILQEETIEAESQSPTKAMYSNAVYDEDAAVQEDEKIFNSYLNLQFIDDSSVEGSPEKVIVVT